MNKKQVNNLASICSSYKEIHIGSNNASDAIINVRGKIPKGMISEEEFDTLSEALEILWDISNQTTQEEAVKYFNELESLINN